jgi:rRNA processing protein Gar1
MTEYCPYCSLDTAGNHQPNCPNNTHSDNKINVGWVCPVCGRVNAPFISVCPCSFKEVFTYD